jgi:hypothetical protein
MDKGERAVDWPTPIGERLWTFLQGLFVVSFGAGAQVIERREDRVTLKARNRAASKGDSKAACCWASR